MLISYIFVFRKQNATRSCNVLFEFLYFGFLDPPTVHHLNDKYDSKTAKKKESKQRVLLGIVLLSLSSQVNIYWPWYFDAGRVLGSDIHRYMFSRYNTAYI